MAGPLDTDVPLDQSRRYESAARAVGDRVTLTEVPGDHFAVIDSAAEDWAACLAAARRLLAWIGQQSASVPTQRVYDST